MADKVEDRRERVIELWGKSDRIIAEILIEEGYFSEPPEPPKSKTKAAERAHEIAVRRFVDSQRRTICNDRLAIRKDWKKLRKEMKADPDELEMSRQEYAARLRSRISDLDDVIHGGAKPGTRVMAIEAAARIESLVAKAEGVDEQLAPDDNGGLPDVPFIGLVLDLREVTPETQKEIQTQHGKRSQSSAAGTEKVHVQQRRAGKGSLQPVPDHAPRRRSGKRKDGAAPAVGNRSKRKRD